MLALPSRNDVYILCTIGLFFLPLSASSQEKIDAKAFFKVGLSSFKQNVPTTKKNIEFPWIEKYEFRTETRDFDLDKQEFTFRITPSTPKKRKAQKAIYQHLRDTPDFDALDSYCDLAALIHTDWLILQTTLQYISLYQQLSVIVSDKELVYNKMMKALELDIEELIKLETEKTDITLKLDALNRTQNRLFEKYQLSPSSRFIDTIPKIESLYSILSNQNLEITGSKYDKGNYQLGLIEKEIALEKAEQKQIFDFGQLRYQGPNDDPLRERVSLGIGFLIPNSGNQKLKILELELEQEELNRSLETDRKLQLEKLQQDKQAILNLVDAQLAAESIYLNERNKLIELSNRLDDKQGSSPIALLEIEERHIKNRIESLEGQEEIWFDYLKFLDRSGALCSSQSLDLIIK